MSKNLFVIDLDKTLLKDNSVTILLKNIKSLRLLFWGVLRKLHLISKYRYLKCATRIIDTFIRRNGSQKVLALLKANLNTYVYDFIQQELINDSLLIILSASPASYVKKFAKDLGFIGYGSYFDSNNFFYLYGTKKLAFINEKYPDKSYRYYLAISDSESDILLLSKFENRLILKNGRIVEL